MDGARPSYKRDKTADELHEELLSEVIFESSRSAQEQEDRKFSWLKAVFIPFGALFIVAIFTLWVIPSSAIKLNPEPKDIPLLDELMPSEMQLPALGNMSRPSQGDILNFVMPGEPILKQAATKVAVESCRHVSEGTRTCYAKAVFYFVRDSFAYVQEADNYYQTPAEMFYSKGGDCDDLSILLASMEGAIGIPSRIVRVPGHVYVQIYLEEALNKYKQEDGWINLDPSCQSCGFGVSPAVYKDAKKSYLW